MLLPGGSGKSLHVERYSADGCPPARSLETGYSVPKPRADPRGVHWMVTVYPQQHVDIEYVIDNVRRHLAMKAKAWVFQHERGMIASAALEAGAGAGAGAEGADADPEHRDHLQVFVSYRSQRLFSVLRAQWNAVPGVRPVHLEKVQDKASSVLYCSKRETRVSGPWSSGIPMSQMTTDPPKDPLEGIEPYDWQQQVQALTCEPPDDRSIYWFWEPDGNVGKTALCKHLVLTKDAAYVSGAAKDILYAVGVQLAERGAPRIVIFDIPRSVEGRISWQSIEQIKNGLAFSAKYEAKTLIFDPPHVLCFANRPPEEAQLSADRWKVHRIFREDPEEEEVILTFNPELRDI